MDIQNYEDECIKIEGNGQQSKILSNRTFHAKYGDFVTEGVKEKLDNGINTSDIPKYMDLSYMCDGEKVDIYFQYEGDFKFTVVNIIGNSKKLLDKQISGFEFYGEVADYLLKKMDYLCIKELSLININQDDSNKIIGPH